MRYYWNSFKKVFSIIMGPVGIVAFVFPLSSVSNNNVFIRFLILLGFVILLFFIAACYTYYINHKNSVVVYSKGKTKIEFLYKDLEEILKECFHEKSTIVVPINTYLPFVGDRDKLRETSIHHQVLYFLGNHGISIDSSFVLKLERKRIDLADEDNCKIGNWFIISLRDYDIDSDMKFLFIANGTLTREDGRINNKPPTREDYLLTLQNLCDTISTQTENEEQVYIPLLGAGNARFGKNIDAMKIISDILIFNKSQLLQHISVFIDPRFKNEVHISALKYVNF